MAEIMKKKKSEVIQKVNVKMSCGCNCVNQHCLCKCTMNTSPSATEFGPKDAAICADLYAKYYLDKKLQM